MFDILYDFLFKKIPNSTPQDSIPTVRTNLFALPKEKDWIVWFGHSSYLIQIQGLKVLVDPVFSDNASPVPGSNRPFLGTSIYQAGDMPDIDVLLITHDHYDHLDYPTVLQLMPKVKKVICGLGVGSHLEHWGYDPKIIFEKDWDEQMTLAEDLELYTATARHFSGRSLRRNNTLWLSFVLESKDLRLYLGGDSGYGSHFKALGERFGGFDLALLDNGQYNLAWQAIHMLPNEVIKAAKDLNTNKLMPVHSSKFRLAHHAWDEPLSQISKLHENDEEMAIITPKIGEPIFPNDSTQTFSKWWE